MTEILETIHGLESLIPQMTELFKKFSAEEINRRPAPGKWSKKEILGHLCDSAFNNIQRLVRVQYESSPSIVYNQDEWVKCNNYQECLAGDILNLWIALHRQFINILQSFPESHLESMIITNELVTARFIITDYLRHQRHHFAQLIQ